MAELLEGRPVPLSSQELTLWAAYFELEPQGEQRADLRAAHLLTLMHNAWTDTRRGDRAQLSDYFPLWRPEQTEEQSAEEMRGVMAMWGALGERLNQES